MLLRLVEQAQRQGCTASNTGNILLGGLSGQAKGMITY